MTISKRTAEGVVKVIEEWLALRGMSPRSFLALIRALEEIPGSSSYAESIALLRQHFERKVSR